MTTAEKIEFNGLMKRDIGDLRRHECHVCGQSTEYDSHLTKKELCEIIVTGGLGTNCDADRHACPECARRIRECAAAGLERFSVRSRESGDEITSEVSLEDAQRRLAAFEDADRADGTFTPSFYEIYDRWQEVTI